jgi:hypothetical protein
MSGFLDSVGNGIDSFFNAGDTFLDHGGQTALNVGGIAGELSHTQIGEGINIGSHALQMQYHMMHGLNDVRHGNYREAMGQGAEWLGHGLSAIPGVGLALDIPATGVDAIANVHNLIDPHGKDGGNLNDHGRHQGLFASLGTGLADLIGVQDHGHEGSGH